MKMGNKREKEEAERAAHKAQLQAIKEKRRGEPVIARSGESTRSPKPRMLIYCEGKNTEPSYFNQFRPVNADIKAFGEGRNTLSLVERAIEIRDKAEAAGQPYDQVWCVFDHDPSRTNGGGHSPQNFNEAIALAAREKIEVAYSIQAFEYWLILHFNDHQGGAMPRDDYDGLLNDYLKDFGCAYDGKGSKQITKTLFDVLEAVDKKTGEQRRVTAGKRAERIYENLLHTNPASEESSTTVHQLVALLTTP